MTYPLHLGLAHEEPRVTFLCSRLDLKKILWSLVAPGILVKIFKAGQVTCQYTIHVVVYDICCFRPIITRHIAVILVHTYILPNSASPICA